MRALFFASFAAPLLLSAPLLYAAPQDVYTEEREAGAPADQEGASETGISAAPDREDVATIPLYSGGIGDEMEYIRSIEHDYTLKLLFTSETGEYLSDVTVHILGRKGHPVADTVTQGPVLLAKLPAGRYLIRAEANGQTQEQRVIVSDKGGALKPYHLRFRETSERP